MRGVVVGPWAMGLLALVMCLGCEEELGEFSSARPEFGVEGEDAFLGADADVRRPDTHFVDARISEPRPDRGLGQPDAEVPAQADEGVVEPPADMGVEPDMAMGQRDMAPPEEAEGRVLYTADRTLSPLTEDMLDALEGVMGEVERDPQVFAKVGASATVSVHNMQCFAGARVALDGRDHLQATIDHFLEGDAAGDDPYTRESLTATVGWSARSAIAGDPSPVEQEVAAIDPRFALIMYGTNDIQSRNPFRYADSMLTLVDILLEEGVIPVLTTVMPRDDDASADALVPQYNAIIRGVAQGRGVPFADFHRELLPLPDHGLGGDDLHPSVYRDGGARACDFTDEGLRYGYNIRNLLMIETLDRLRRALLDGGPAPDARAPRIQGAGVFAEPFEIGSLPFTDLRDTEAIGERRIDRYSGCDANQDESGPEVVYRLELDREVTLKAMVFDRGDVDIDLHLLDDSGEAAGCLQRDHQALEASLAPGVWYFVLDSFVSGGESRGGEFIFTVVEG